MSNNLYEANAQWSTRPDDERFESLQAMHAACLRYAQSAATANVALAELRVEANDGQINLVGKSEAPASLTHYSFGQLARLTSAPSEYLRRLPATLAAQNINHGLKTLNSDAKHQILFHRNGQLVTRAITTGSYDRVWNHEIVDRLIRFLEPEGWRAPPARPARPNQRGSRVATASDLLPNQGDFGLAIKEGDLIAPAGLYASDHDMFAFLVNQIDPVFDGDKYMHRGVFIQNSEVGDCSLKFKLFTYDNVCGNHIVWGVGEVQDISVRHVKAEALARGNTLRRAMSQWQVMANRLPSGAEIGKQIEGAKAYEIGATKDEVLDALFSFAKKRSLNRLNRATLTEGYDLAERTPRYGSPRSVWGMVNGLTELSQGETGRFTDMRTDLDVQAGRIMEMAF
jgi:hypothetical protein